MHPRAKVTIDTFDSLYEIVYQKSIGTKMNDLTFAYRSYQGHVSHCGTFDVEYLKKPLEIWFWFQRTTNKKCHISYQMVT